MRAFKIRSISLFLCLSLIVGALSFAQVKGTQPARTIDPVMLRALEKAAVAIQASFDKNGLKDVLRLPALMKEAGISYDASLLATTDPRVLRTKDRHRLYALRGIYGMDILYSLAFGKRIDSIAMAMASIDEAFGTSTSVKWQTILNDGDIEAIADAAVKYFTNLTQESKTDNRKNAAIGITLYGFCLESFYLYAKTGLATGATNDFAGFLQKNIPLLKIFEDIFKAMDTIPQDTIHASLDSYIDTQSVVVEGVLDITKKTKGKPTEADLRAILAIVEKPRNSYLTPGK